MVITMDKCLKQRFISAIFSIRDGCTNTKVGQAHIQIFSFGLSPAGGVSGNPGSHPSVCYP